MCGIVGYTGPREAGPVLLDGLRRLEYRGYDSAGIALVTEKGDLFVEKRAGKVAVLTDALGDDTPSAGIGLGHTRWATHGRPSDLNAHPHSDCTGRITVVHNGIVENFRELRDELVAGGHILQSETDTEVVAHLVEDAYEGDLANAVRVALKRLEGAYALVVMNRDEPQRLVGARLNAPLIVGIGDGESFVASDAAALVAYTKQVIFLADGDVADLTPGTAVITDRSGAVVDRPVDTIPWSAEAAEKGGYAHFMLKEIHEQPEALTAAMTGRLRGENVFLEELEPIRARLAGIDRVEMIACGTAYYASLVGAALFQEWLGVPARSTVASEFRYSPPPIDARTLVVAVTQSGETADTIAAARMAGDRGAVVVAVTNTVGSAITRESHASVFLQAGPEVAVAATKTFVTQVATLIMLAADVASQLGRLKVEEEAALVAALRKLPAQAERAIEMSAPTEQMAEKYAAAAGFMYIGRSFGYPAALEGALKIKEISYLHAEGYAAGELKHGPISLLDEDVPLVAVATRSAVYEKLISNLMEGKARDARVIAVATEGDVQIERLATDVCWVPDTLEPLSTILAVIPLQLFAYYVAVKRGRDVDQPRNLAKSVTVE
ncbi:MAG TPA: glutamine--fructose-6-phosphate transaminase (isomerizing) [Candidatus Limnocylindrales bacterium]